MDIHTELRLLLKRKKISELLEFLESVWRDGGSDFYRIVSPFFKDLEDHMSHPLEYYTGNLSADQLYRITDMMPFLRYHVYCNTVQDFELIQERRSYVESLWISGAKTLSALDGRWESLREVRTMSSLSEYVIQECLEASMMRSVRTLILNLKHCDVDFVWESLCRSRELEKVRSATFYGMEESSYSMTSLVGNSLLFDGLIYLDMSSFNLEGQNLKEILRLIDLRSSHMKELRLHFKVLTDKDVYAILDSVLYGRLENLTLNVPSLTSRHHSALSFRPELNLRILP